MTKLLIVALVAGAALGSQAATVTISATADTGLHEANPDNNMGGVAFVPAGSTVSLSRTRGLFRFDLTGKIPAGATVTSAKVNMNLIFKPGGTGSTFDLHRMLQSWTEGNKVGELLPGGGAIGDPPAAGEVTWNHRASPSTAWGAAGASATTDSSSVISSSVAMDAVGSYSFPSTPSLVADVQAWINTPATNFGWLMRSASEAISQTARRFGSREGNQAATLEINYTVAAPELRITDFHLVTGGASITWTGGLPNYRIQQAENILGPWTFVTPSSTETTATAPRGTGDAVFYRVASEIP